MLPELFLHGYGTASAALGGCALARDAAELTCVGELARHHKLCICLPYVERGDDASSLFNSVAIFQPQDGRLAHNYQKVHLAGRAERALFSRGAPDSLRPCDVEFASGTRVSLGVAVCYDLEFPEPSRCLAVQGAEVLIAPTAVDELATTPRFIPARAMENQMFVLHANPEGRAPASLPYDEFSGGSGIYAPDGKALVMAGEYTGGTLLTATLALDENHAAARSEYMSERRALSEGGHYDPMQRHHSSGAVVGSDRGASSSGVEPASDAAAERSRGQPPGTPARGFAASSSAAPRKKAKRK